MAQITEVPITGESIRLGQLLKLIGIARSGGEGKALLLAGGVRVNGECETRRGRRLRHGDVVQAEGETARVVGADQPGQSTGVGAAAPPAAHLRR
jgi:ribosome-associated protein